MATIDVKDAGGLTVAIEKPLIPARAAAAASRPVVLSTEDKAVLDAVATETTVAAILAKIIAAPATEATLAAILAKIIAAPATEATLAAVLAKIIAAPATEAKQDTSNAVLGATTGAAVVTNVNGTIQQYLRGLITQWIAGTLVIGAGDNNIGNVDLASAIPAGTNNIGDVDLASAIPAGTNNIGDVDLASAIPAGTNNVGHVGGTDFETVAASATAQVLGPTGALGDYLSGVLIIPATTSPGAVTLIDNATSIIIFAGGASSVSNLVPFFVPIGAKSASGAWKLTTGLNVSCIGVGDFT